MSEGTSDEETTDEVTPGDATVGEAPSPGDTSQEEVVRGKRAVSVSRIVRATPEAIFDVLSDPAMHPVIDGSGSVRSSSKGNPERLELGSRFGMGMRIGLPYLIRNRVVEYEQDRRIAWRHFNGHRWRYELEPVEGGTLVTETFDWSTAHFPPGIEWLGFPERHPTAMAKTLERLAGVMADRASGA